MLNPVSPISNGPDGRRTLSWSNLPPLPPRPISANPDPREDGVLWADITHGDGEIFTLNIQFKIRRELPSQINNRENENCSILGGTIRYGDIMSSFDLPRTRLCTQFYLRRE